MNKIIHEIFLKKFNNTTTGCWEFNGYVDKDGYGQLSINNIKYKPHRLSYMLYIGEIEEGMVVRHTCDNGKCVNPFHLIIGTHADNVADRVSRKRSAIHENNGRSKLTLEQAKEIKYNTNMSNYALAKKYRICQKSVKLIKKNINWKDI